MSVYFLQAGSLGPVKVGWAQSDIKARIAACQTGSPYKLELLAVLSSNRASLERGMHKLLRAHRMHGEWFRWHYPLSEMIEMIASGELTEATAEDWYRAELVRLDRLHAEKLELLWPHALRDTIVNPTTSPNLASLLFHRLQDLGHHELAATAFAERVGNTGPLVTALSSLIEEADEIKRGKAA